MNFKDEKSKADFESEKVSVYLKAVAQEIDRAFYERFNHHLIVTAVLRDVMVQIGWCIQFSFRSDFLHCGGFALDFRRSGLTELETAWVRQYAKDNLGKVCKLDDHLKGTAPHLHLCTVKEFTDRAKIMATVKNVNAEEYFTG